LQFQASFTTSRAITLNPGGGTFDTAGHFPSPPVGNNVTLAGPISGSGELTKTGAGTLTLSHAGDTYSGGTALDGGTLDVAALNAAGTGAITFNFNLHETLDIDNAALFNNGFGNAIKNFHQGHVIDLTGLKFVPGATASYNSATNTLKVSSNGVTDTLTLIAPVGTMPALEHPFTKLAEWSHGAPVYV
jgi:autotransporter-associated beta strand protein